MKNKLKTRLKVLTLLSVLSIISVAIVSCGPENNPEPGGGDDPTSNFKEEFLILDGVRYEADDFSAKILKDNNSEDILEIQVDGVYPKLFLTHEREQNSDTVVCRDYEPFWGALYDPDFDTYYVQVWYTKGPLPNHCQYMPRNEPPSPHEKYELTKVDGKYVSEFGKIQVQCGDQGAGEEWVTVEGYVIWEEK